MRVCLKCLSTDVERINAEVSFTRGVATPVYTLGKMTVCLRCGFAEYLISAQFLAELRRDAPAIQIPGA